MSRNRFVELKSCSCFESTCFEAGVVSFLLTTVEVEVDLDNDDDELAACPTVDVVDDVEAAFDFDLEARSSSSNELFLILAFMYL